MCRILSYLGRPILTEELLYKPDNSFIKQSYHPKYMSHLLNLAGFGIAAWDTTSHHAIMPHVYKTEQLPFYDENLHNLASKIMPHCLLAHLRGVSYNDTQVVSMQNVHPFIFPHTNIALAHNGSLFDFEKIKYDLLNYILPQYQKSIRGTTDSEWIYAILMSQFEEYAGNLTSENIIKAVTDTLSIIKKVRHKHHISTNSPVNLFITNGEFIAATRFVFDYGWEEENAAPSTHSTYHSLWYTYGESYGFYDNEYKMRGGNKRSSIIIASEPLTADATTWVSVPEYTMLVARIINDEVKIDSHDINL